MIKLTNALAAISQGEKTEGNSVTRELPGNGSAPLSCNCASPIAAIALDGLQGRSAMTELPAVPWEGDLMNRRQAADFLQQFLDQTPTIKVLNVNSAWGSGKTFFIQNWHVALKQTRASVYFNAWENDYTGDPFVSLAANIKEQLQAQSCSVSDTRFTDFTKSAAKTLVGVVPAVGKGLLKKWVGVDADVITEAALDAAEELAEKTIESIINKNSEVTKQVREFRALLGMLCKEISKEKSDVHDEFIPPVYIFIDELDRCRPTYAIELLERVKHFFSTESCVFVVATDSAQLRHSIRAVYGTNFDSERYLRRFFNVDFSLDNSDLSQWVSVHIDESYKGNNYARTKELSRSRDQFSGAEVIAASGYSCISRDERILTEAQVIFLAVCKSFGFELRDMENLKIRIESIVVSLRLGQPDFFWICYLCALKHYSPERYTSFIKYGKGVARDELPQADIYTGYENVNVHELALMYKLASGLDPRSLVSQQGSDSRYSIRARVNEIAMINKTLSSYPQYVELAASLNA